MPLTSQIVRHRRGVHVACAHGQNSRLLYGQGRRSITVAAVDFRDLNREIGGGAA